MRRIFIIFFPMLLIGCARPAIQIDASAVEQGNAASPVGLLEVHRGNSGEGFGLAIGESVGESLFCTASVLADGRVATSSDCLRNKKRDFAVEDMEFHLNRQGSTETNSWKIEKAEELDGIAYLTVVGPLAIAGDNALLRQVSLASGDLPLDEKSTKLAARALSVGTPNDDGVAVVSVVETEVEFSAAGFTYREALPEEKTEKNRNSTRRRTRDQRDRDRERTWPWNRDREEDRKRDGETRAEREDREDREERRRRREEDDRDQRERDGILRVTSFRANGLRGGETAGTPIVVDGKVIGMIRRGGTRSGLDNVRWFDKRRER